MLFRSKYQNRGSTYVANIRRDAPYISGNPYGVVTKDTLGNSCKGDSVLFPSRLVIIGEHGSYDPAWSGLASAAEDFVHTRVNDHRFNLAYADGHSEFTSIVYRPGVQVMWTNGYSFDRFH